MMDVIEAAKGKWHGILPQFGIDSRFLTKKRGPCPICGGKDRFFWDNKEGRGTFYCQHCGAGSGVQLVAIYKNWTAKQAIEEVRKLAGDIDYKKPDKESIITEAQKKEALNKTWAEAKPIVEGDPVSQYLIARTGRHWRSNALRIHPALWHPEEKKTYPAMIAKITDPDNKPVSIHRTFLTEDGKKPKIEKNKMLMAGSIPEGSAIRLLPFTNVLGIAEGIETALSASAIFDIPVWAAISANVMVKWEPPETIEKIIIFADSDRNFVGQLNAFKLAYTIAKDYPKKYDIYVSIPNIMGADWNDVLTIHGLEIARNEALIYSPAAFRTLFIPFEG
jgi:putative DNA primase/helicase